MNGIVQVQRSENQIWKSSLSVILFRSVIKPMGKENTFGRSWKWGVEGKGCRNSVIVLSDIC